MRFVRVAFTVAFLFATSPASGAHLSWDRTETDLARVSAWLKDIEKLARIIADPAKRAIVCRVPFFNFTPKAMIRATKLPQTRLMHAVNELEGMGLVTLVEERGYLQVAPASEDARVKMRRWADNWCVSDDTCGLSR